MKKPLLSEMTLREKIGQCLCIPQFDLNVKSEVSRDLLRTDEERDKLVSDYQFGTVWCHGRQRLDNIIQEARLSHEFKVTSKQYIGWVKDIEKNLNITPLKALDGEVGGAGVTFCDLSKIPNAISIGASDDEQLIYNLGVAVAKEYKCAGLNWKWTPVCDLANRFTHGMMRTYSQDIDKLIRFSNAHVQGMQSVGVAATVKHFPSTDKYEYRNAHFTTSTNSCSMEEWWEEQGMIFQSLIDKGVWSIMTTHATFPACDDTKINGKYIPATLSKKITNDLLKEKMGFKGVVVTDNIKMGGLMGYYEHDDLIVEIMKAGNDVILSCDPHDTLVLEKAVLDGRLEESRIDDACSRVLDMKEKMGLFDDDYDLEKYKAEDVVPHTQELINTAANKAIHLLYDNNNMLPLDKSKVKKIAIICSTHLDVFYEKTLPMLKAELEKRGAEVYMQRRLSDYHEVKKLAEENDLLIYAANLGGEVGFYGEESQALQFAFSSGNEKSLGVSFEYPYIHYDFMTGANTFINTHCDTPEIISAFVKAIYGEIPFVGKSPVSLEPTRRVW